MTTRSLSSQQSGCLLPMQSSAQLSEATPSATHDFHGKERCHADSDSTGAKRQRVRAGQQCADQSVLADAQARRQSLDQLPSPALTRSGHETKKNPLDPPATFGSVVGKRKAQSHEACCSSRKRVRLFSEPVPESSTVNEWLLRLPPSDRFEPLQADDMNRPPSKRSRSTESLGGRCSQSGDGSDTVFSDHKKYLVYQNANYTVVLETKGSFARSSKLGMIGEDRRLCDKLLTAVQPLPEDTLFDDEHFTAFHANLRGRSEARICVDLHPRVMPSVENLYLQGRQEFEGLIEGHNDPWMKSVPFYGPRPQPDHTFGFKWTNFSEHQRHKLGIEPTKKSFYTAREDIYFPFLTGEVKCGKHGLELADLPNTHSMTVHQRGIVHLYRQAKRADEVHRRVLGFSISHDDHGARLYAHYPEIDGEQTTYWRETLREFTFTDDKGKERWTCYRFTLNVCALFSPLLLTRLKSLIDELPDPAPQSFGLTSTLEDFSVREAADDTSAVESQDDSSMKAPKRGGINAELRSLIQGLQRQLEQQRHDAEQQMDQQRKQTDQQRKEMDQREVLLLAQLEQQRKELEQQRKESGQQRSESEQQRKELTELLKAALQKR